MPAPQRPEWVKLLADGAWEVHPVTGSYFPSYVRLHNGVSQVLTYSSKSLNWFLWQDNGVIWEGGLDSCLMVADSK